MSRRTRRSTWSGTRMAGSRSIISRLVGAPTAPPLVPPRLAHRHSTPPVLSIITVSRVVVTTTTTTTTSLNMSRDIRLKLVADRKFHVFLIPVPRPTFTFHPDSNLVSSRHTHSFSLSLSSAPRERDRIAWSLAMRRG